MNDGELRALLDSWLLRLRAERKADQTITSYRYGVEQFLDHCRTAGVEPRLDADTLAGFVNALLDAGKAPATAVLRQLAVRRFSAWLADEDEIDRDLLVAVKPPKVDTPVVDELSLDEVRALVDACRGKSFTCRRDEAIVRFMLETGARAGEVVGMNVADVELHAGVAVIRRGKGGKGRRVPFGPQTGAAVDRYLRLRRSHRRAQGLRLWLGARGLGFGYPALAKTLKGRANLAGVDPFHPHMLRHTFAGRWLEAGGSEQGLLVTAGWSRRDMIDRYSRQSSERRAAEEARRLGLGDI